MSFPDAGGGLGGEFGGLAQGVLDLGLVACGLPGVHGVVPGLAEPGLVHVRPVVAGGGVGRHGRRLFRLVVVRVGLEPRLAGRAVVAQGRRGDEDSVGAGVVEVGDCRVVALVLLGGEGGAGQVGGEHLAVDAPQVGGGRGCPSGLGGDPVDQFAELGPDRGPGRVQGAAEAEHAVLVDHRRHRYGDQVVGVGEQAAEVRAQAEHGRRVHRGRGPHLSGLVHD